MNTHDYTGCDGRRGEAPSVTAGRTSGSATVYAAIVVLLSAFATDRAAQALEVCNKTNKEVEVVIGKKIDGVFSTRGWYKIANGDCRRFSDSVRYARAEATSGSGAWSGRGGARLLLCAKSRKGRHYDANSSRECERVGGRMRYFKSFMGRTPDTRWTLRP